MWQHLSIDITKDYSVLYFLPDLSQHGISSNLQSMTLYLGNFIFIAPVFGEILKGNERSEVVEAQGFVCFIEGVELTSVNIRDPSGCNSAPQNKQPNDLISLCLHKGNGGQWMCVYGGERVIEVNYWSGWSGWIHDCLTTVCVEERATGWRRARQCPNQV